jgi:Tfp pilus assembly protein PilF
MTSNLWSAKKLFVILSLSLAFAACQTPESKPDEPSKEEQLAEKQKMLIRSTLDEGKPDQALANLRPLLRQYPNDAGLQNLMGLTQLALRNGARAVKHFTAAYKIDHSVATGLNLSSAYIEVGDHEKSVKLLMALTKQAERDNYPYKERIYHNIGLAYVQQKRMALAEKWYEQAIEENPTFFPSHLELAKLYERTKRPAMAMKAYRRSIDFCLVCFEPVQALSSLYVKNNRYADARRLLINFGRQEGASPEDVKKASRMLKMVTAGSGSGQRKG